MNIRPWVEASFLVLGVVLCVKLALFSAGHIWSPGIYVSAMFVLAILIRIEVLLIRYWK